MPYFALSSLARPSAQLRKLAHLFVYTWSLAALLLLPASLSGQTGAATLSGTIVDRSGALMPQVRLTIYQ